MALNPSHRLDRLARLAIVGLAVSVAIELARLRRPGESKTPGRSVDGTPIVPVSPLEPPSLPYSTKGLIFHEPARFPPLTDPATGERFFPEPPEDWPRRLPRRVIVPPVRDAALIPHEEPSRRLVLDTGGET